MLYADYARRKMHNVVKLDTAEGYPLTVYSCANTNLKDYTIYGNTVYGENLFNYTEPYNDNQIIADADGWFDVTIDNTEGTSTAFKSCVTKVNNALKPDTEYILFTEIAECTGTINVQVKTASSNSQFTGASIRYDIAGTRSATITTFSSFDNCTQMLSSTCYCGAGRSGHAKFRIAVYETQKDVFLPYSKNSVGDKTKNLFDKAISTNADIKNETTITSSAYSVPILKNNAICEILKPDTTYTISCEFECTAIPSDYTYNGGILGFMIYPHVSGYSSMYATINKQMLVGERYKFSKTFTTPSNFGTGGNYGFYIYRNKYTGNGTVAASMICRNLQIEEGTSATSYEPYNKYKIPITVTGKNLLNFDGIEDITLDDTTGAIRGGWAFRNLNAGTYTLSANISIPNASLYARIVVNGVSQPTILISGASQSLTVNDNDTILIYTPSTSATLGKTYLANKGITSLQFEKGTTATSYEPYHEPVTTNIYRDAQLGQGESINYKSDSLPDITLKKGTNIITADTEVKPSNIKIKYLKK